MKSLFLVAVIVFARIAAEALVEFAVNEERVFGMTEANNKSARCLALSFVQK